MYFDFYVFFVIMFIIFFISVISSRNLVLGDNEGSVALAAVLTTVLVHGHEGLAVGVGALAPQAGDLAVLVNLVVVENCKLDVFVLVGDSLGLSVDFFLSLLASTTIKE